MNDLLEQGIEALRAGNKDQAYQLLTQATQTEPDNAKGWYYLAGATPNRQERRQALERVLTLMPDNDKAREALAKMDAEDTATEDFEQAMDAAEDAAEDSVDAVSDAPPARKVIDATDRQVNRTQGETVIKTGAGAGFKLPVSIPGAPNVVNPQDAFQQFRTIFMNGVEVLKGNQAAYDAELRQASWWRFWLYVALGAVIIAVLSTISSILFAIQFANVAESLGVNINVTRPNLFNVLTTLILTAPINIFVLYGGIYVAQWWLTNQQGGNGAMFEFAYALMLPVFTANLINAGLTLASSMLTILSPILGLVYIVISIVAWWRAAQGIAHVHNVPVQWAAVLSIIIYIVATIAIGFVLGLLLSPFLLASSVSMI